MLIKRLAYKFISDVFISALIDLYALYKPAYKALIKCNVSYKPLIKCFYKRTYKFISDTLVMRMRFKKG